MRNGTCPRCGAAEACSGAGVSLKAGMQGANSIPVTFWSGAAPDNDACARCGYAESHTGYRPALEEARAPRGPKSRPKQAVKATLDGAP